jgi:hypothetical protein
MKKKILFAGLIVSIIFSACKKTSEEFKTDAISDYAPLIVGKYITYQLDSLVFADNIIPKDTVISYQVKHVVEDTTTDNLGRKAFTIRRYIRKNAGDLWVPDNTFTAINTGHSYEFIENNFRFLKLVTPIKNGFTWKGNSYIDTSPEYSDFDYLSDWDYAYDSLNTPLTLGTITIDSTLKVFETDQVQGDPNDPAAFFSEIDFSVSNYGRGIGLVYHRFLHQQYQNTDSRPYGYKTGYGITLTMIDHN